jgi:hypothetical protein
MISDDSEVLRLPSIPFSSTIERVESRHQKEQTNKEPGDG